MRQNVTITLAILAALATAACSRAPQQPAAPTPQQAQMRTVDSVDPRPTVIDPPPVLTDESPPPKPKVNSIWEVQQVVILTPEDEKVRAALPFSPAIAMDPVDGSKISIRAATPTMEYKGKIFYFSTAENKATFAASPEQFTKSGLMRL
jgi:YHS domain-containing protein